MDVVLLLCLLKFGGFDCLWIFVIDLAFVTAEVVLVSMLCLVIDFLCCLGLEGSVLFVV